MSSFWRKLFGLDAPADSKPGPTVRRCQKCGATFTQPPNQSCPLCGGGGSLFVGSGEVKEPPKATFAQTHSVAPPDRSASFHDALKGGNLEKVRMLLKTYPDLVRSKDRDGDTPLHVAALNGHEGMARLLLANKAEINAKGTKGGTPLHYAAFRGHEEVARLLLANRAEIDAKANGGETPLLSAVLGDRKNVAELLLTRGADVNAKNNEGQTPLHRATFWGRNDLAVLLRHHGGH